MLLPVTLMLIKLRKLSTKTLQKISKHSLLTLENATWEKNRRTECVTHVQQENSQSQKDQLNEHFVKRTLNVLVKIRFGSMKDIGDRQQIHLSFMNVSMNHLAQV